MTQDLHYLKSILGHLRDIKEAVPDHAVLSLGNMALADDIDWLDCHIDSLERGSNISTPAVIFDWLDALAKESEPFGYKSDNEALRVFLRHARENYPTSALTGNDSKGGAA